MRRRFFYLIVLLVLGALAQGCIASSENSTGLESTRSWPPDTTPYARPAVPEDSAPSSNTTSYARPAVPEASAPSGLGATFPLPGGFIVDVVVNNTNPTLTNTDIFNDGETSIAVNPANPAELVITA